MEFTVPTLEELHAMIVADGQARFPDDDFSKYSDNWKRTRMVAAACIDLHAHVDFVYDSLLPDKAAGAYLLRLGNLYGVPIKQATVAYENAALRLVGTAGSTYADTDELVHADGTRFRLNASGTIPGPGFVDVDVIAIDVGSIGRKQAGEVLTFVSAPAGIQTKAELQIDIVHGGTDLESDGDYRDRILDKIGFPGMGGNANDYRAWALEVSGIDRASVYPLRQGYGSVDLAAFHSGRGAVRILDAGEVAALQAYIDAKRPISVRDFRVLTTVEEQQAIEILLTPEDDPSNEFDWDDTTPLVVDTWTSGTRTLKFTTDRPPSMKVGHRLTIKSAAPTYNAGAQSVIEAFAASDEVILVAAPDVAPVAADTVYAGGPLVDPVRDAVQAHVDALGPSRETSAATGMIWEGTLRTSKLFTLTQLTPGVLDSTIIEPSGNVEPTDRSPDAFVNFITASRILVRRAH